MDEKALKQREIYQKTFETVADQYGTGACRFFHDCGEYMATLHGFGGVEHVLDIASGTGAAAIPIAQAIPDGKVTCVDFSPAMLKQAAHRAKAEGLENIDFQICDMTAMPFAEQSFDHANCAFGLFFVDDMVDLLSHIKQKVKRNGSVMMSSFCGDSFLPQGELLVKHLREHGLHIPEKPLGWKRIATTDKLEALFAAAGLQNIVIARQSFGYYTTLDGWWEVVWNAGFRGLVEQLEDLDKFKQAHLSEVEKLMDEKGLWLEVDVHFTKGNRVA